MQYVNAFLAAVLTVFALMTLDDPRQALMFGIGAALAAVALKHWLGLWTVRFLATATAVLLYWYFGQFFLRADNLEDGWYASSAALPMAGLLIAGFAMIPVLSEYSCRMKAGADCERARRQFESRKSVLASLRPSQTPRSIT